MTDLNQSGRDQWQSRLSDCVYQLSVTIKELHQNNPWPEQPVLPQAINTLATDLWDQCFSQTEIRTAVEEAINDLPRYAAGEEVRG